jgi:hypothetical protein
MALNATVKCFLSFIHLQIPTVKEEIRRYSSQYSARLSAHTNEQQTTGDCEHTCQMICLPDS